MICPGRAGASGWLKTPDPARPQDLDALPGPRHAALWRSDYALPWILVDQNGQLVENRLISSL